MKILICTGIFPPDIGGPATYSNLIREELKKRGHQTVVLTYSSFVLPLPLEKGGGEGFLFPSVISAPAVAGLNSGGIQAIDRKYPFPIRYFLYFWKVLQLGKKVDVIYVQDPVSVGLPTALANLFLNKKLILKIVGDYAWEQAMQITNYKLLITNLDSFYPFNNNHSFKIKLLQKIQTWVAKKADKIITPSFYLKNILTNGWKINSEKIKVIYNSFDVPAVIPVLPLPLEKGGREGFLSPSVIPAPPSVIPAKAGIQDFFRILSAGRLVPWKGFGTLIEITKDIPNVELEIIGNGPLLENFKFQISNFKLENRIRLSGKISHDQVVQKMYLSDLFVLNSNYEGLSHVILEAMAVGLSVAVSHAGGNTELLGENEERGYLFEYNNNGQIKQKINYIIAHPEEVREKAQKARDFVAGFSKDKMIEKLEKELEIEK